MVIVAYVLIAFGGLMSLLNWGTAVASWHSKHFVSSIPLVGALPLGAGMVLLPETRPFAWLALIADYGTLVLVIPLPWIAYQFWSTSRIKLLYSFTTKTKERAVTIKLFRRQIAEISAEFAPPIPCNDHDGRVQSFGLVGKWSPTESGFSISGYASNRQLLISKQDGDYATIELNYPSDKKYKYDCLNGLVVQEQN